MANIQVLEKDKHLDLKLQSNYTYPQSQHSHIVQVSVFELAKVAAEYPIAFVKDRETGQFHLVALLGLQPNENLFYNSERWLGNYIPLRLRAYPFMLAQHPEDEERHLLCVDLDNELISSDSGQALFSEDGNQSPLLHEKANLLGQISEQSVATQEFVNLLTQLEVLSPQSLSIKPDEGDEYSLTGLYAIDESKLNALSADSFENLRRRGALSPIYACLFSMHRIENLVKRKASS